MSDRSRAHPQPRPHIAALAPFVLAERTVAPGVKPIHLAQNENASPPSPTVLAAMRAAIADSNRYSESDAATLRGAIAAAEGLDADRIICGSGSMELLSLLAQAYLGPEDEIVLSQYGYIFFRTVAAQVGARQVLAPERDFRTNVDAILAAVGPRCRAVFIANPNNPTGSLLPQREVARLRASLPSDVLLVIDAAYGEYVTERGYDPGVALVDAGANSVMTRTFSKIHGLAGLRVGWAYVSAPIAEVLNRLRHPNNVSTIAIAGAAAAIADRAHMERVRAANAALRRRFTEALRGLGLAPCESQTNFVLVPFDSKATARSAQDFLKARGILTRPMHPYGLDHCLRITLGTEAEMEAATTALTEWCKR